MRKAQVVRRAALVTALATAMVASAMAPTSAAGGMQFTGDPVKVMTIINLDPAFGTPIYLPGIQAAVRAANADDGLVDANGDTHEVELEICDARNANDSEACARKAIDEGYVATLSDVNTLGGTQATELLEAAGVPQLGATQVYPKEQQASNQFPLSAGIDGDNIGMVYAAKKAGLKRLHVFESVAINPERSRRLIDQAADQYGVEIVGRSTVPFKPADMGPFVQAAKSSDADGILFIGGADGLILTYRAFETLGYDGTLVTIEGQLSAEQVNELGEVTDRTVLAGPLPPFTAKRQYPAMKQLIADLRAEVKAGNDAAGKSQRSTAATRSWIAFKYLEEVVKTVSEITAASISDALNTVEEVDLGLIPPFKPSEVSGIDGFERVSVAAEFVSKYENGQAVLLQKKPIDPLEMLREGA